MYLKSLEMHGFKSFAERTKLVFEPGLVAIVGPNGCGKSNVSDAIRWVLGEQKPSALRGAKMADVIFNGTDTRKQTGMCEVSISFADCEAVLGTDYNEVTITRRVFRTGESGYFINKTPCRLKDIQRLFMGTGIGTASYSVMAQGQIDAILSSRPEDRRTIFEEAAGITKYKADRKEALRKLEETESNLARIQDVVRELRRQIASLQRQAAKAEKYRALKAEMRSLDIYVARQELSAMDLKLRSLAKEDAEASERENGALDALSMAEESLFSLRAAMESIEESLNEATKEETRAQGSLDHAREIVAIGEQRIEDYRAWLLRDNGEIEAMQRQISEFAGEASMLGREASRAELELVAAAEERENIEAIEERGRLEIERMRQEVKALRDDGLDRERRALALQKSLAEIDGDLQGTNGQIERLEGQRARLLDDIAGYREREEALLGELEPLRREDAAAEEDCRALEDESECLGSVSKALEERLSAARAALAGHRGRLGLLEEEERRRESYQSGAKLLLDGEVPGGVLGTFAGMFAAEEKYAKALAAALRAWEDAVVLSSHEEALAAMGLLSERNAPVRIIAAPASPAAKAAAPLPGLEPLLGHVRIDPAFAEKGAEILGGVYVAEDPGSIPSPMPEGLSVATLSGMFCSSGGFYELLVESGSRGPVQRHLEIGKYAALAREEEERISAIEEKIGKVASQSRILRAALDAARARSAKARNGLLGKEAEAALAGKELAKAAENLANVAREADALAARTGDARRERERVAGELDAINSGRDAFLDELALRQGVLQEKEAEYSGCNRALTDAKIREARKNQELMRIKGQISVCESRIGELKESISSRRQGMESYGESIAKLTEQVSSARDSLLPMEEEARLAKTRLAETRAARSEKALELERAEGKIAAARQSIETIRRHRGALEVETASVRLTRQSRMDRIQSEYFVAAENLDAEPPPALSAGAPSRKEAEERMAWLSGEIANLGSVNLVAADECRELEERCALHAEQEADLLKARDELAELVKIINRKSSEIFMETFNEANANFEKMFTKLFNGGTAKLAVVENESDPLDCGVEIIARPPGKRPQSISLLSGGERTMTAVSLLFAIYLIKPSPFCLLDELDAALDDSNIGRFVQALKDFLVQSQFLIITHNQHTIANSGIVYGVTMAEKGVSKIVSMRLAREG